MTSTFNLILQIVNTENKDLQEMSGIKSFLQVDQFKLELCNWLSKQRKSFLTVEDAIKEFKRNETWK